MSTIRLAAVLTSLIVFVAIGLVFIPQVGIEDDEALIVSGLYGRGALAYTVEIAGRSIPMMLMSYVGTLKSWIYAGIFQFWEPSLASLRVPVVLAGGLTVWLFYRLLLRVADSRTAVIGCILLSTDTLFLLTTCFDWGPVALQHLLLVAGALCLIRFSQERKSQWLAIGCWLFGLALWDKVVFAWIFSGMIMAAFVIFPKELRKLVSIRNVSIAVLSFCLGAGPSLLYNLRFPLVTFRLNTGYSTELFPEKTGTILTTLSGAGLFGHLVRIDPAEHPSQPQNTVERISVRISETFGHPKSGFFGYAFLLALLLIPWVWATPARRPILFSLITMLVAWLQMLFTRNAGTAAHHVILLWPFPALIVAVAFARVSRHMRQIGKPLLAAVVLLLASTNLLVTNEYFASSVRNGSGPAWTDAIFPLADYLNRANAEAIYVNDWGIFDVLRLLSEGDLPVIDGSYLLAKQHLDESEKRIALERIAQRRAVFVSHTDANETFKGVNAKLRALAAESGYRQEMLAEIADRNGRTLFEAFRFSQR